MASEKHFPDIFQQLSADLWGVRMREKAPQGKSREKNIYMSLLVLCFAKLCLRIFSATLLCAIGDIIPVFFPPAIIYDK